MWLSSLCVEKLFDCNFFLLSLACSSFQFVFSTFNLLSAFRVAFYLLCAKKVF